MNVKTMITSFTKKSWLVVIFFVSLLSFFGVGIQGVAAAGVGFNYEHNFGDPRVCGPCTPVGLLEFGMEFPDTVTPSSTVTVTVAGTAVEALAQLPICPTVKFGNNGVGSMPVGYTSLGCYPNKNDFANTTVSFVAPSTPGVYQFCAQAGMNDTVYLPQSGVQCASYTVSGATVGTINVSSNIAGASYTITGPATLSGSGVSNSHPGQPTGGYTITWNDVAGYTKPGSSSQTLSSGGTISFVGNYSGVAPTCSYTGPINWVEPTGLECSVGVSYNSIPVGGQRTATDSDASGNGYTGSYTAQCDGSGNFQYVSHVCNAPTPTINVNF